jgi:DUF971 family protein
VTLKKNKKELELTWNTGEVTSFSAELLRVESPSAEVRGHSPEEKKVPAHLYSLSHLQLVDGKADVRIVTIEPRGNYAIRYKAKVQVD